MFPPRSVVVLRSLESLIGRRGLAAILRFDKRLVAFCSFQPAIGSIGNPCRELVLGSYVGLEAVPSGYRLPATQHLPS